MTSRPRSGCGFTKLRRCETMQNTAVASLVSESEPLTYFWPSALSLSGFRFSGVIVIRAFKESNSSILNFSLSPGFFRTFFL